MALRPVFTPLIETLIPFHVELYMYPQHSPQDFLSETKNPIATLLLNSFQRLSPVE